MRYLYEFDEDDIEMKISHRESKEIVQTCRDILLDLKDENSEFVYLVYDDSNWVSTYLKEPNRIKISIQNEHEFQYQEIEHVVSRLAYYMESIGYIKFYSKNIKEPGFFHFELGFEYK